MSYLSVYRAQSSPYTDNSFFFFFLFVSYYIESKTRVVYTSEQKDRWEKEQYLYVFRTIARVVVEQVLMCASCVDTHAHSGTPMCEVHDSVKPVDTATTSTEEL